MTSLHLKRVCKSSELTSHLRFREKRVLKRKTTQKRGHTVSPSQKICDSALSTVFPPSACSEKYTSKPFMYSCVAVYDKDVKATVFCYTAVSWPVETLQLRLQVFHFPQTTHRDKADSVSHSLFRYVLGCLSFYKELELFPAKDTLDCLVGNLKILFFPQAEHI